MLSSCLKSLGQWGWVITQRKCQHETQLQASRAGRNWAERGPYPETPEVWGMMPKASEQHLNYLLLSTEGCNEQHSRWHISKTCTTRIFPWASAHWATFWMQNPTSKDVSTGTVGPGFYPQPVKAGWDSAERWGALHNCELHRGSVQSCKAVWNMLRINLQKRHQQELENVLALVLSSPCGNTESPFLSHI